VIDLDAVIAETYSLPALPQSASRLASLLSTDDWELDDVTETVKRDSVLAGRILRAANSASRAGVGSISLVDQAVMRIGPGSVLAMAMGVAARDNMLAAATPYGIAAGDLWKHGVAASLTIEVARKHTGRNPPPEAHAAALLHDIGIIVLTLYIDPTVQEVLSRSRGEGGCTLAASESEILEVHHGEVGGLIAGAWGLPAPIVEGITFHHTPELAPSEEGQDVASHVALADCVADAIGAGGHEADSTEDPGPILKRFGLDPASFEAMCSDVSDRLDEVLSRYE